MRAARPSPLLRRTRPVLAVEPLEARTLLSADLVAGVLNVSGSNSGDVVHVGVVGSQVQVTVNGTDWFFNLTDVSSLSISLGNGHDHLSIETEVEIDATIYGGNGKDTLDGGGGNDEIHGQKGKDVLSGDFGEDELYGENGKDDLDGDEDDDYLDGGGGHDSCWGGGGGDIVRGGNGRDYLDGEDGEDLLDGEDGDDEIDDDDGDEEIDLDLELEFEAEIADGLAQLYAAYAVEFGEDGVEVEFEVEVEDAAPCSVYYVMVDDFMIGTLVTDPEGYGELGLSNDPDEDAEASFPVGMPSLTSDSRISLVLAGSGSCDPDDL